MQILLTNDDGIDSEKLQYTRSVLEDYGEVYLVAPQQQQSAKSMSLTIGEFRYVKVDDYTYAIEGTPVDCVNFAIHGLKLQPDLVVSGVNDGYNLGIDTRYSGTVGACLQAQYFNYNTIALSADKRGNKILKEELKNTLEYIFDNNLLSPNHTLNINFPREKFESSKGIIEGRTYYRSFHYEGVLKDDTFYPNRQYKPYKEYPEDTDISAYMKGYISICPIKV
ncbi:MAG: 5'/3'-nucleotidase SurE [Candidatus Izemoplasma sp.]|nr:5'/3'-nucleotidase SurE [Candidatus Izemoplasma sp.]